MHIFRLYNDPVMLLRGMHGTVLLTKPNMQQYDIDVCTTIARSGYCREVHYYE